MPRRRFWQSMRAGLAYAVAVGLLGAGIVHIAVLLLLPELPPELLVVPPPVPPLQLPLKQS